MFARFTVVSATPAPVELPHPKSKPSMLIEIFFASQSSFDGLDIKHTAKKKYEDICKKIR
jgi:hypothetical protein